MPDYQGTAKTGPAAGGVMLMPENVLMSEDAYLATLHTIREVRGRETAEMMDTLVTIADRVITFLKEDRKALPSPRPAKTITDKVKDTKQLIAALKEIGENPKDYQGALREIWQDRGW